MLVAGISMLKASEKFSILRSKNTYRMDGAGKGLSALFSISFFIVPFTIHVHVQCFPRGFALFSFPHYKCARRYTNTIKNT